MSNGLMQRLVVALGALVVGSMVHVVGCAQGTTLPFGGSGGSGGDEDDVTSSGTFTSTGATTGTGTASSTTSSSQSSAGSTTGPGPASSSSGSGGCDNTGDCNNCFSCAMGGPCAGAMAMCQNTQDCLDFMDCISPCQPTDMACASACINAHATGYKLYTDVLVCAVCQNCYNDCDGASQPCQ